MATKALTRELNEEMYISYLRITTFIGLVENMWDNQGEKFHENCFIFQVESDQFSKDKEVTSKESHLKFLWVKFSNLEIVNFLPKGMYDFLKGYERDKKAKFFSLMR